jgi:hypothetical protein
MKSFFWDKLPDQRVPGTFWEGSQPVDWVNFNAFEDLFQQVR